MTHDFVSTARAAVAYMAGKPFASTAQLQDHLACDAQQVDAALAPLVDAKHLVRVTAFRAGANMFDYRYSSTWKPADKDFECCSGATVAPTASISPVAPAAPAPISTKPGPATFPQKPMSEARASGRRGASTKAARDGFDRRFNQAGAASLGWTYSGGSKQTTAVATKPAPKPQPISAPAVPPASATAAREAPGPDAQPSTQEQTVKKAKRPTRASPQFQICAALLAHGDLSAEKLRKKVKVDDDKSFASAVSNSKFAGRIEKLEGGELHLTKVGAEWVNGGANLRQQRTQQSPAKVVTGHRTRKAKDLDKGERQRLGVVAHRNGKPVAEVAPAMPRSFRCAVFSDGGFFLAKGDQRIELDAIEHRSMLNYLDRMAPEEAAA